MKSPIRNSRRRGGSPVSKPIAAAVVAACLFLVIQLAFPSLFASLFLDLFGPLWSSGASVGQDLAPRSELLAENAQLKEELAAALVEASSSAAILLENQELEALLGQPTSSPSVMADVAKGPPGAGYDFLVLDEGTAEGIAARDPVYAPGGLLIGSIVQSSASASKVELYSSPGLSYSVLIGQNHVPATANGQGGGAFSASVSRQAGISAGDPVIVPGVASTTFGTVGAVISDPSQPFATILWSEPVNVYGLDRVTVGEEPGQAK